jgi:putative Mg2+ transporter-C (MgtC) family protein
MKWLTADWKTFLDPVSAHVGLALAAVFCGALIGMERQRQEKAAGLRTLVMVCLGSAGFTMAGYAFTTSTGDSGRVAAQIVTGIGFLGAGVILHPRGTISGATTAAGIWVTASVGMMAGAGYAGAALGMSLLVRLVLAASSIYEARHYRNLPQVLVSLDFEPGGGRTRVRLERVLVDYSLGSVLADWQSLQEGLDRVTLHLRLPRRHFSELLDDLVDIPEVKRVRQQSGSTPPEA